MSEAVSFAGYPEPFTQPEFDSESAAGKLTVKIWEAAKSEVSGFEWHTGCRVDFEVLLIGGAERMLAERRTMEIDVEEAAANVRRFLQVMKEFASSRGHPLALGEDTLEPAKKVLLSLKFELWPFWPPFWVQK